MPCFHPIVEPHVTRDNEHFLAAIVRDHELFGGGRARGFFVAGRAVQAMEPLPGPLHRALGRLAGETNGDR